MDGVNAVTTCLPVFSRD